jgi:hypothetical protein
MWDSNAGSNVPVTWGEKILRGEVRREEKKAKPLRERRRKEEQGSALKTGQ